MSRTSSERLMHVQFTFCVYRDPRYPVKKGVPIISAKLTETRPCKGIFFIKNETLTQVFSCKFYKIFKNTFSKRMCLKMENRATKILKQ